MAKTCPEGFLCFTDTHIILLLLIVMIIVTYLILNFHRLTLILKDKQKNVMTTFNKVYGVPINVPTRGIAPEYERIGSLHEVGAPNEKRAVILPLFGRQTYSGSHKWKYYTMTDQYNMIKLPVQNIRKNNCMQDMGCEELYSDDKIFLDAYSGEFTVQLYIPQYPKYIPI
tara:strand:- start:590 stop:1099 length:510 start_codon:yes stop_codon:yes gene_type:complete